MSEVDNSAVQGLRELNLVHRVTTSATDTSRSLAGVVAVTGASGFIGRRLISRLLVEGVSTRRLSRDASRGDVAVDFADPGSLAAALDGVDTVFHCAGRAHAFAEANDAELHRQANEWVTLNTARAAAAAGVRRFVFLSSVKAIGEPGAVCVDESFDAPAETAYGRSKRAAEQGLEAIAAETGMQIVCLRLAMVYGPGSRGNLERMMRLVAAGRFPSLPDTGNRRSLLHVEDLVEAIVLAGRHPAAVQRTYIVAHPAAVSGRFLFVSMCEALGRPVPTHQVPVWLLRLAGKVGSAVGTMIRTRMPLNTQAVDRLLDSACYSPAAFISEIGWQPRVDLLTGLQTLADDAGDG